MIILKANITTKIFSVWDDDKKLKEFNNYREAKRYKEEQKRKKEKAA